MKNCIRAVIAYVRTHKKRSVIALAAIIVLGFAGANIIGSRKAEAKYVMAIAEKGSVITSVTGSGQVSASSQVDLKPKMSGDIVYVGVSVGDEVKKGTLIARIDSKDAEKTVRDTEIGVETAQISFDKLTKAADATVVADAENALSKAQDDLNQARSGAAGSLSSAFSKLPADLSGLHGLMFGSDLGSFGSENVRTYRNMVRVNVAQADAGLAEIRSAYDGADVNYRKTFADFSFSGNATDDDARLSSLIDEAYASASSLADAVRKTANYLKFVNDDLDRQGISTPKFLSDDLAELSSYSSSLQSVMSDLMAAKNSFRLSLSAVPSKLKTLDDLKNGPDDLDLRSARLALAQRQNSLADAKERLADCCVRAPFDGIVAKLNVRNADSVSSESVSSGTSIATLVTRQQLAEISLNEVDVSKVKVGNKATVTFDAVPGLSISGSIVEINAVGTISQGVVTYDVKIAFDTQDDRIKAGMTLSASIITDVRQNVLTVPNAAVKSQGDTHYIEVAQGIDGNATLDPKGMIVPSSEKVAVEIGSSNDEVTEISSGIGEGDVVVVRPISSSKTTLKQTSSLFGGSSGGGYRATGNMMMGR